MTYLELLQRALAEEIEATRLYLACMALAPREDLGVLLEINKDETDHVALISSLISRPVCREISTGIFRGVSLFLRWIIIFGCKKSKGYVKSNRLLFKLRVLLFYPRISVFYCKENDDIY